MKFLAMDNHIKHIKPMELNLFRINTTMSKKELRTYLCYKPGKWSKSLITLEPELKKISPGYKRLSSILTPKEVKFIILELVGLTESEFIEIVREKQIQSLT